MHSKWPSKLTCDNLMAGERSLAGQQATLVIAITESFECPLPSDKGLWPANDTPHFHRPSGCPGLSD